MVASRKRRTEVHRLLIASFRIWKDLVKVCSKISPSTSNVLCPGGGIGTFPSSDKSNRSRCNTFQARNQLCFEASVSAATQPPILFRKGRLSNIPEFHPAPAEKGLDAPPLCLKALPGLQSPCGRGLSGPEKRGSFLLRCH